MKHKLQKINRLKQCFTNRFRKCRELEKFLEKLILMCPQGLIHPSLNGSLYKVLKNEKWKIWVIVCVPCSKLQTMFFVTIFSRFWCLNENETKENKWA